MPVRGANARGATYERQESEFYPTPPGPVHALLDTYAFSRTVLDPCCGDGAMLKVFRERGYRAIGCDIRTDARDDGKPVPTCDYLRDDPFPSEPADIVTNPPFGPGGRQAELFIGRALQITRAYRGSVAMLLSSDFDSGSTRTNLFRDHPAFQAKIVLLRRIVWFDRPVPCKQCGGTGVIEAGPTPGMGGRCANCKGTGMTKPGPAENHAWYVWGCGTGRAASRRRSCTRRGGKPKIEPVDRLAQSGMCEGVNFGDAHGWP